MTDESGIADHRPTRVFGAERAKAFIDAVVAIAMTLLILPLMESVTDVADEDRSAAHWFGEHQWQLVSFVISFAIIAMFWISHHRLFAQVERVSVGLLWASVAWLLTIVWLPVATAMSGRMSDEDPLVRTIYIGSMLLTCLTSLVVRAYLRGHPQLHEISDRDLWHGMVADLATALLFAASLGLTLLVPAVSYFALFLMLLAGPVQALLGRLLRPAAR